MTKPAPSPSGLGKHGQRLWDEVTAAYQMRPDELRVLEDSCREVDLIEQMQAALPKQRFTTRGSMGQTVAHPLLTEIRQHRATLASLLKQLKLTDLAAGAGEKDKDADASTHARKASIARWGRG